MPRNQNLPFRSPAGVAEILRSASFSSFGMPIIINPPKDKVFNLLYFNFIQVSGSNQFWDCKILPASIFRKASANLADIGPGV